MGQAHFRGARQTCEVWANFEREGAEKGDAGRCVLQIAQNSPPVRNPCSFRENGPAPFHRFPEEGEGRDSIACG